jgi:uncharacterized phiE125 gp8 family phage protein
MPVTIVTAPTEEPVTLAEAKNWLRVEHSAEDALIKELIGSARQDGENATRRTWMAATLQLRLDHWPRELPRPPVQSVSSVEYVDPDGQTQTFTAYQVDTDVEPARIWPDNDWPKIADRPDAVRIKYDAGWSQAEVPQPLKVYTLMRTAELYDHRTSYDAPEGGRLPKAHKTDLLARYMLKEVPA